MIPHDPSPSTLASVHQPNFMPWAKLADKILASDVWVVYDTAQYTKTEFHSRQRIKGRNGPVWLSIPVRTSGRASRRPLCEVELAADHDWRSAHLRLLREHYQRAPHWAEALRIIEPVYAGRQELLADFSIELTEAIIRNLGSQTRIVRASQLPHGGDRTQRVIDLTRAAGADGHLTSTWGSTAVDIGGNRMAQSGIAVVEQRFAHPVYPQLHGAFEPGLGIIDLLCNVGPAGAQDLIAGGRELVTVLPALSGELADQVSAC